MVGIVIITYNLDIRVFLLQVECIRKFCKDDYVIEVFDNSTEKTFSQNIQYHAKRLGISYKKTHSASKNGSDSHSFAANFAFWFLEKKYSHFLFLDHDCIPVKEFSVSLALRDKKIAGLAQGKDILYFWPGLVMWDNKEVKNDLVDFSPSHQLGLDTGGGFYKIIDTYGEENCIFFNEVHCELEGFKGKYGTYSMLADDTFLHFVGASGWENKERQEERIGALVNITNQKISDNVD